MKLNDIVMKNETPNIIFSEDIHSKEELVRPARERESIPSKDNEENKMTRCIVLHIIPYKLQMNKNKLCEEKV